MRIVRQDQLVPVDLLSRGVRQSFREGGLFHTAIIDLSEIQRAEAAGALAERHRRGAEAREVAAHAASEAKDRFLAELSHELRTPLTPILAAVASLQKRSDVPDSLRPSLDLVQRNIEIEARLIDDLLDVSRLANPRVELALEVIDVHETLRAVLAPLAHEIEQSGVAFRTELGARSPCVIADPLRLSQVLWNLVANALRNTPPDGEVLVTTSNIGEDLRIIVRDTGVGIERDRLKEIFSPFSKDSASRLARGKLGLGLAIVKGIVEAHGGRILAFSHGEGRGAAFVVELKAVAERPVPVEERSPEPSEAPTKREAATRVLLVEDHPDTREALEAFLRMNDYEVKVAGDVSSALAMVDDDVDIVVCDIGLPDGTGFDLMRQIGTERTMRAIALTGYGAPHDVELAAEAGFDMHLTKPVGAKLLIEAIEKLVASERSA